MKRTELKRGRRKPRARVSAETVKAVHARQRGKCACGCGGAIAAGPIGLHHVFPKQRWPELIDVAENIIGATANCHANHETASKRFTRAAIAPAEQLVQNPQMRNYLENTYGRRSPLPAGTSRAGSRGSA